MKPEKQKVKATDCRKKKNTRAEKVKGVTKLKARRVI